MILIVPERPNGPSGSLPGRGTPESLIYRRGVSADPRSPIAGPGKGRSNQVAQFFHRLGVIDGDAQVGAAFEPLRVIRAQGPQLVDDPAFPAPCGAVPLRSRYRERGAVGVRLRVGSLVPEAVRFVDAFAEEQVDAPAGTGRDPRA